MMRFKRPPEPSGFANRVAGNKRTITDTVAIGNAPDFTGRETWKEFKKDMAPATFGKCGYCEVDVWAVDRFKGDVEHYRPKGRVDELIFNSDGTYRTKKRFDRGYHWLAYDWRNYILSCNPCNSAHKKNLFPLEADPGEAPTQGAEIRERPLLLDPHGRRDPTKHLVFDHLGIVGPRKNSKFGKATIAVCGLDRSALEKKRRRLAEVVKSNLDVFGNGNTSGAAIDLAIENLALMGLPDREHAGMVRAMFTEATGLPWSFIEAQAPKPEPAFDAG